VVAVTGGVRGLGEEQLDDSDGKTDEPEATAGDRPDYLAAPAKPDRRLRPLLVAVSVVAVLGLVGTGVFAAKWNGLRHGRDAQNQASSTARQFLLALTNFDGRTVNADFDRILTYAAPNSDFAKSAQSFFGSDVRQALQTKQAASQGQIRNLFVQSVTGATADVYAVIDQTIFNNSLKQPEADTLRVDVTLVQASGLWRVSEVTVLQAPPVATSPLTGSTPTTAAGG
jgi:hypothetical protein